MAPANMARTIKATASEYAAPCYFLTTKDGQVAAACLFIKGNRGLYVEDIWDNVAHRLDAVRMGEPGTLAFYCGSEQVSSVPFARVYQQASDVKKRTISNADPFAAPLAAIAAQNSMRIQGFASAREVFVENPRSGGDSHIKVGAALRQLMHKLDQMDLEMDKIKEDNARLRAENAHFRTELETVTQSFRGLQGLQVIIDENAGRGTLVLPDGMELLTRPICTSGACPKDVIEKVKAEDVVVINVLPMIPPLDPVPDLDATQVGWEDDGKVEKQQEKHEGILYIPHQKISQEPQVQVPQVAPQATQFQVAQVHNGSNESGLKSVASGVSEAEPEPGPELAKQDPIQAETGSQPATVYTEEESYTLTEDTDANTRDTKDPETPSPAVSPIGKQGPAPVPSEEPSDVEDVVAIEAPDKVPAKRPVPGKSSQKKRRPHGAR